MSITVNEPTLCRIDGVDRRILEPHLSYVDKRVDQDIARLKRNAAYIHDGDQEKYQKYLDDLAQLKKERKKNLLFEDERGLYTLSGLAEYISLKVHQPVDILVKYPEFEINAWSKPPRHPLRSYQEEALDLLLA